MKTAALRQAKLEANSAQLRRRRVGAMFTERIGARVGHDSRSARHSQDQSRKWKASAARHFGVHDVACATGAFNVQAIC
jgi:hypothetical protein